MRLHFLGANRQVTGSRYLLETAGAKLLIDCGMFQERAFTARNWEAPPFDPSSLDAVLLTHAHLDHCGLLPRLSKQGFKGPIYTHAASIDLASLVLEDAARLQVEDVRQKRQRHDREGRRSPHPYEPLYLPEDARRTMAQFRAVKFDEPLQLPGDVRVTWREAGHILGSAMLEVHADGRRILFSGDLGMPDKPLIRDPAPPPPADVVILESTYGNREHDRTRTVEDQLAPIISTAVERGGNVLIPTFAIERAQELLFHLNNLLAEDRIPHVLAFLDSPMAVDATHLFTQHRDLLDDHARAMLARRDDPLSFPGLMLCRSVAQSKAINRVRGTAVIMAGAGMCTGGRIKHHLERNLPREESAVIFVGYQSQGTLGRDIANARPGDSVRIFNHAVPVRASISQISGMSAHADRPALLRWLGQLQQRPRQVHLTHGEASVSQQLAEDIQRQIGCAADVPEYGQVIDIA
jgi:metallo-beta-lactamase family protein